MVKYSLHSAKMFCLSCYTLNCKRTDEYPDNTYTWVNLPFLEGEFEDHAQIGHLYQNKKNKKIKNIRNNDFWNISDLKIVL